MFTPSLFYVLIAFFILLAGGSYITFINFQSTAQKRNKVHAFPYLTEITSETVKNDVSHLQLFFESALEGCGESAYAVYCKPSNFIPLLITKIPKAMEDLQLKLKSCEPILHMPDPIVFVNKVLNLPERLSEFDHVYEEFLVQEKSAQKAWMLFIPYFNDTFLKATQDYMQEFAPAKKA